MRQTSRLVMLLAVGLILAAASFGCTSGMSNDPQIPDNAAPVRLEPVTALEGMRLNSGIETRERLVVRDDATWTGVWLDIVDGRQPAPPTPKIDFEANVAIVAASGTKTSGGYTIDIDEVSTMDGDAWVSVTETNPGRRCGVTATITAPIAVVIVPRFEGKATFVEHQDTRDCN
jgi:PrcB C-terminal